MYFIVVKQSAVRGLFCRPQDQLDKLAIRISALPSRCAKLEFLTSSPLLPTYDG